MSIPYPHNGSAGGEVDVPVSVNILDRHQFSSVDCYRQIVIVSRCHHLLFSIRHRLAFWSGRFDTNVWSFTLGRQNRPTPPHVGLKFFWVDLKPFLPTEGSLGINRSNSVKEGKKAYLHSSVDK